MMAIAATDQLSPDAFDVNLVERVVVHKPSRMPFFFYEYLNEEDWKQSDSVSYRDNPDWEGNRMELAAAAKQAAIAMGMTATRPHR